MNLLHKNLGPGKERAIHGLVTNIAWYGRARFKFGPTFERYGFQGIVFIRLEGSSFI